MNTSIVCLPGNAPFLVTDWPGFSGFLLIASPSAPHGRRFPLNWCELLRSTYCLSLSDPKCRRITAAVLRRARVRELDKRYEPVKGL